MFCFSYVISIINICFSLSFRDVTIAAGHCTCMAGLGESCSHVGALLFKMEAAARTGVTKRICTEVACQWNNDFVKKIHGVPISEINFYKDETKAKERKKSPPSFPGVQEPPTEKQLDSLLTMLSTTPKESVVLHCFSKHFKPFVPKFHPPERAKLPPSMRDVLSNK